MSGVVCYVLDDLHRKTSLYENMILREKSNRFAYPCIGRHTNQGNTLKDNIILRPYIETGSDCCEN